MTDISTLPKPPTKADYKRYSNMLAEIHADIAVIEHALFRLSKNLKTVKEKRLYLSCGGHATFQDFCQKELGNTRQQTYRLIQAHDVMQDLLMQGVPYEDLPKSERLCREIRLLPAEKQASAWKAIMRVVKQTGKPPTIVDVQAEVQKDEKPSETLQRQQNELLRTFETASASIKTRIAFNLLEPAFRRRLTVVLIEIAETVKLLIHTLRNPAVEARVDPKDDTAS